MYNFLAQAYITAVGHEFRFLDNFDYVYESESEPGTPGPFTRSFQALDISGLHGGEEGEEEEEGKEEEEGEREG